MARGAPLALEAATPEIAVTGPPGEFAIVASEAALAPRASLTEALSSLRCASAAVSRDADATVGQLSLMVWECARSTHQYPLDPKLYESLVMRINQKHSSAEQCRVRDMVPRLTLMCDRGNAHAAECFKKRSMLLVKTCPREMPNVVYYHNWCKTVCPHADSARALATASQLRDLFVQLSKRAPKSKAANIPALDLMMAFKQARDPDDVTCGADGLKLMFVHMAEAMARAANISAEQTLNPYGVISAPASGALPGHVICVEREKPIEPYRTRRHPFTHMLGPMVTLLGSEFAAMLGRIGATWDVRILDTLVVWNGYGGVDTLEVRAVKDVGHHK